MGGRGRERRKRGGGRGGERRKRGERGEREEGERGREGEREEEERGREGEREEGERERERERGGGGDLVKASGRKTVTVVCGVTKGTNKKQPTKTKHTTTVTTNKPQGPITFS